MTPNVIKLFVKKGFLQDKFFTRRHTHLKCNSNLHRKNISWVAYEGKVYQVHVYFEKIFDAAY